MNAPMLTRTLWLAYQRPVVDPRLRVFCFPHAGGSSSFYWDWGPQLPDGLDLRPVQLPGRERRLSEAPYTEVALLVRDAARVLRPLLDVPFAFFGHSMGALISFELARELRRTGAPLPVRLFLSGHRAPHLPDRDPPIHALPDSEFLSEIQDLNGTDAALLANPEIVDLFLPLLRADIGLCERYVCAAETGLDIPFTVYGGIVDPDVTPEDLQGWQEHSSYPIQLRIFPGDHFYLTQNRDLFFPAFSRDIAVLMTLDLQRKGEHALRTMG